MKIPMAQTLTRLSLVLSLLAFTVLSASAQAPKKKLLVVTVTKGFRHSSIPTAEKVIGNLAERSGDFSVDYARNDEDIAKKMTVEALKQYDGFIFANTTGNLPLPDKQAFLNEIKQGKGFVGMHSASDTFHGPKDGPVDPFIEMLGGEFQVHHEQVGVECLVKDHKHASTTHFFGGSYCIEKEEIYLFINHDPSRVNDLLSLDKHPNDKKKLGHYPISWSKSYGKGNVFYTSLGHNESVWENKLYQDHILGGIRWVVGIVDSEGFKPLFNGRDLTGWKLRNADGKQSWSVKDGILVNTVKEGEHGTDLLTEEKYRDFTVKYEYMVPPGSNSGFYLRGRHEIQILDDYKTGTPKPGGNGAIYEHTPVSKFVSRKPGEWQTAEATIRGNRITLFLNGEKVHDRVEVKRATGGELDNKINEPGPILLQGDHGTVSFRNIRIKEIR